LTLVRSLVEKERLLGELMRSQKEFESMKHSFESKLQVAYPRIPPSPAVSPLMYVQCRRCKALLVAQLTNVTACSPTWSASSRYLRLHVFFYTAIIDPAAERGRSHFH
jgi:hypothetical protein